MAVRTPATKTDKVLGRHTRLGIPFRWKDKDGELINLQGENYTARVWVSVPQAQGDPQILGPFQAQVSGNEAVYQMRPADLESPSLSESNPVTFTCVAENNDNTLPPNKRQIVVGDWGGADEYAPAD